tara:strand:+ start:5809 stop:7572 length:1764 start_codon:yes stop_codon:yes gene_type:complete
MRIPTYRSQTQITTEAPGRSFTARKNPNPFIQQAQAKGNMQAQLFSQAASYAQTQRKIKVEALKNEAILGAKEAMMELSDAFLNDNQPYDIFNEDGTGRWDKETNDIKKKLRAKLGTDKYALAAFDTAFAQAELSLRFQLKGQIDTKIEKMHVASVNEGWEDFIEKYADPNVNPTTFELDFAGQTDKTDTAIKLGQLESSVKDNLSDNVLKRIAVDLMPAYAGRDLSTAMDLIEAYEQIQLVKADKIDEPEFSDDIPAHVLNVLQLIPPADAQDILEATLESATKFYNFQEKIEDEILETQNRKNTKAYNFALGVHNGEIVTAETMEQLLSPVDLDVFKQDFPNGAIGIDVKHFLNDVLGAKGQFWLSKEQQDNLAKEIEVKRNIFALPGEGNAAEYSRLYATAQAGMLRAEELNNSRPLLEPSQHRDLVQLMQSESDEALNEADNDIKLAFKYNEMQAIGNDDNLAKASISAYQKASRELLRETSRRQIAQDPMTREEMFEFAQKQVDQFMVGYRAALKVEYLDYLDQQLRDFTQGFRIDPNDPIGSVQDWYDNLTEDLQTQKLDLLVIFKAAIRSRFSGTGLFDE